MSDTRQAQNSGTIFDKFQTQNYVTNNIPRQPKHKTVAQLIFYKVSTPNLMFVWPCIIDINNVEDQLNATVEIYWYSNQLNMFRAIFAHPQEHKTLFYSMWYNASNLPAGSLERGGTAYVFGVKDDARLETSFTPNTQSVPPRSRLRAGKLGALYHTL